MKMAEEGDHGINFSSGSPFSSFVKVAPAKVGDIVTLYNLSGGDRLAVPSMNLSLNAPVWVTPDFDFAGFDWKIPFDFLLIPFIWDSGYIIRQLTDDHIIDNVKGDWVTDALIGKYLKMVSGTNAGKYYPITDNGDNWLSVDRPSLGDNSESNFYNYLEYPDYCTVMYEDGVMDVKVSNSGDGWNMATIWWGAAVNIPGGSNVTFQYRCRGEGARYSPRMELDSGNWIWTTEDSYISGPPGDWVWRWGGWTTRSAGCAGMTVWSSGDPGGWNTFGDWVELQIKNVSVNGYQTMSQMGFAVNDHFMIVDTLP